MIGAIVYRLRAEDSARMPAVHGKLLHGVLFRKLQQFSSDLSAYVHGEMNIKPFTSAQLQWVGKPPKKQDGNYYLQGGEACFWRVTALQEILLQSLLEWETGSVIRIGTAHFLLEKVMANPDEHTESGIMDENELIAACLRVQVIHNITFQFISPVSFRYFQQDMPLPKPELIFGSIADKWNQAEMPICLDKEEIRELAMQCDLIRWEGKSCKTFFSPQHGVNGFTGAFTFDVSKIDLQYRQLLLLLAQYSVFSGVGRLTGQGMGQSRVLFK